MRSLRRIAHRGGAARLLGVLLALALSAPALGALASALDQPAGVHCCCRARGPHRCSCPVCAHAREQASNRPLVRSCTGRGAAALPARAPAVYLAHRPAAPPPLPALPLPPESLPQLHDPPPAEVPTPPPLA